MERMMDYCDGCKHLSFEASTNVLFCRLNLEPDWIDEADEDTGERHAVFHCSEKSEGGD